LRLLDSGTTVGIIPYHLSSQHRKECWRSCCSWSLCS
jgi:hypothetical protein